MKRFIPSTLSLAVAASLTAVAISGPAQARDLNAPFGASATLTGQIATNYYIAQPPGGWTTLMNVTNTSNAAIAVKVRLKEFKNSREILDFIVMMSPYDVWTGWIYEGADGGVYLSSEDNSCISPYSMYQTLQAGNGQVTLSNAYTGSAADGGSPTLPEVEQRKKEGHVEFIVMGQCDNTAENGTPGQCFGPAAAIPGAITRDGIGYLTKHVDGVPRNCQAADGYFVATDASFNFGTAGPRLVNPSGMPLANNQTSGSPFPVGYNAVEGNPLHVNVAYLKVDEGTGSSVSALHFDSVIPEVNNLITAQQYPWNLEPTIATAPSGQLWNMSALLDFEQLFSWTDTFQEWSVNPAAGVQTSVVLNFPTKAYHVDQYCNQIFASNNRWRWNGTVLLDCASDADFAFNNTIVPGEDYDPDTSGNASGIRRPEFLPTLAPFRNRWVNGRSDVEFWPRAWDREEYWKWITRPSPEGGKWVIPWEVAQIVFDPLGGALGASPSNIFIDTVGELGAVNGWINLDLDFTNTVSAPTGYGPVDVGRDGKGQSYGGLPVQALMIKTRDQGIPSTSYGQGNDNGFRYCLYNVDGTFANDAYSNGWACSPTTVLP